jgi:hypothetical protein
LRALGATVHLIIAPAARCCKDAVFEKDVIAELVFDYGRTRELRDSSDQKPRWRKAAANCWSPGDSLPSISRFLRRFFGRRNRYDRAERLGCLADSRDPARPASHTQAG